MQIKTIGSDFASHGVEKARRKGALLDKSDPMSDPLLMVGFGQVLETVERLMDPDALKQAKFYGSRVIEH